jgi:glycerol uptake facilitator-like aquaporin
VTTPTMMHRLAAEFLGTFWLVLGGCGSAVFAAKFLSNGISVGIGFLGVATAFGLTVLTGVYAFGTLSGGQGSSVRPSLGLSTRCCSGSPNNWQKGQSETIG